MLKLLNTNVAASPDEIVARLNTRGWVCFGRLTDEDFVALDEQHMVVIEHHDRGVCLSHGVDAYWEFWANRSLADRHYFLTTLRNYWGILAEEFDGTIPDREALGPLLPDPR